MTPEAKARERIDQRLSEAGWAVRDVRQFNPSAAVGVAVREYPTDTGPADYVLFVNRSAVGVIEAKRDDAGENLTVTETQTERYANATLKWRKDNTPLPFLFESTGQIIRFTDGRDPAPRSRELFHFYRPEHLADRLQEPDTLRRRLAEHMPPLPARNLRECQISAVAGLERSLADNRPRALIHMATGAGKTFTAITAVYRLLKHAIETRIFPSRKETPKTLIFAKTDSHADDIVQIVREIYGQGNAFCKKVTYRTEEDPDSVLASFRNDYYPRIAVTVDMIATGTDVKPLEVLLFMRDVRSRSYYEQMKGRGVRSLDHDALRKVSNSADSAKTRFVLIDAVGVEKSCKTDSRPLGRKPGVPLKDLMLGVALGHRDEDTVLSLANRLSKRRRTRALGRGWRTIPGSAQVQGLYRAWQILGQQSRACTARSGRSNHQRVSLLSVEHFGLSSLCLRIDATQVNRICYAENSADRGAVA